MDTKQQGEYWIVISINLSWILAVTMGVFVVESQAGSFIRRIITHQLWQPIDTRHQPSAMTHLKVFSCEQLNSHDGEDEPEDDTDHQDVEDAGDGLDESINNNLGKDVRFCCKVLNS